jgi:anaphase-promoting complex subunit 4
MDALFHGPRDREDEAVDVILIGSDNGTLRLSIYGSFEIGTFDLWTAWKDIGGCQPVLHVWHPNCPTHALLVQHPERVYFVPVDLRFLISSGEYLSLLAAKSTQLQNLLRYINQVQAMIHAQWKTCQDLPRKFLSSINSALQESCQTDFVFAAYHLAVTGHCLPEVKEWLVDVLSERV